MVNTDRIKRRLHINGALVYALCLAWVFWIVWQTGDKSRLVYVMNAFLFGSVVALCVMYWRFMVFVISEPRRWNRSRQFVTSTGVLWIAIILMTSASIWRNSTIEYNIVNTNFLDILTKYIAIIAAQMQIFAPHHGEKLLYETERKSLVFASLLGVTVSIGAMIMQVENLLSW